MVAYDDFINWKAQKNAHSFSEAVFVAYFKELAVTRKSSTLWALYSMLINIKNYVSLVMWLKRQSDGYKPKKSKIFTSENVQAFINQAPHEIYLATKVTKRTSRIYHNLILIFA